MYVGVFAFFQVLCCSIVLVSAFGCSTEAPAELLQSAQLEFDKAVELEKTGSIIESLNSIEIAISTKGLNPDQLATAYLLRSRCRSQSGNLIGAEEDLNLAELGTPNPSQLHWTKGVLLEAKGEKQEAKVEFSKAKKLDPSFKWPSK